MKLIVGLGNPGPEYSGSRHNVGFRVVDVLADRWSIVVNRQKHRARCGTGRFGAEQIVLLKPQTYMNGSGSSVAEAMGFYKVGLEDLLVVVDDMALAIGRVRLRPGGSAGGHNGLGDIIGRLSSDGFARLRVGIGSADGKDAVGHVLGWFGDDEKVLIEEMLERSALAAECWVEEGVDKAMSKFNTPRNGAGDAGGEDERR